MRRATAGLDGARELERRAHLARDGVAHVVPTLVVFGQDGAQQVEPLLAAGAGESGESGLGGGHGTIDVGGAADRNLNVSLLGRGIDDVEQGGHDRVHPLAVDIEMLGVLHGPVLGLSLGERSAEA